MENRDPKNMHALASQLEQAAQTLRSDAAEILKKEAVEILEDQENGLLSDKWYKHFKWSLCDLESTMAECSYGDPLACQIGFKLEPKNEYLLQTLDHADKGKWREKRILSERIEQAGIHSVYQLTTEMMVRADFLSMTKEQFDACQKVLDEVRKDGLVGWDSEISAKIGRLSAANSRMLLVQILVGQTNNAEACQCGPTESAAPLTPKQAAKVVEEWNAKYPIGTSVRYWCGLKEGDGRQGETRAVAQLLHHRFPVVWVTGHPAYIALTHVEPQQ